MRNMKYSNDRDSKLLLRLDNLYFEGEKLSLSMLHHTKIFFTFDYWEKTHAVTSRMKWEHKLNVLNVLPQVAQKHQVT